MTEDYVDWQGKLAEKYPFIDGYGMPNASAKVVLNGVDEAINKALSHYADRIEKLAYQMPPPNNYTPQFMMLAIEMRKVWQP